MILRNTQLFMIIPNMTKAMTMTIKQMSVSENKERGKMASRHSMILISFLTYLRRLLLAVLRWSKRMGWSRLC